MDTSIISTSVITIFLFCIILGFLFGYIRGYQKSLVRFLILLAVTVLTFFVVPSITSAVLEMDISKWNINIGGVQVVTLGDLIVDMLEKIPVVQDLIESSPTFESIITLAPQLIANVLLFIVFFFVFKWFSMAIYWIIAGIFFSKKKMGDKDKHKFVGAVIGLFQGLMIAVVLFVPVYGVVETAKPLVSAVSAVEETKNDGTEESVTPETVYVSSTEISTEEGTESVEPETGSNSETSQEESQNAVDVLKESKTYVDAFDDIWLIKVFNALKIKNISVAMFDGLTTVKDKHVELSLRSEVETIAKAYPGLSGIINNEVDTEDPEFYDDLNNSFDILYSSPILSGVVSELVPAISRRWTDPTLEDNKFCGIGKPTFSDESTNRVFDALLENLKSQTDKDSLKKDLTTSIDVMKLCASSGVVGALKGNGDIMDTLLLEKNQNLISDIIDLARRSTTLLDCLPRIIDLGMNQLYKALDIKDVSEIEASSSEIDWDREKVQLQKVFNNVLSLYDKIDKGTKEDKDPTNPALGKKTALDCLDFAALGRVFDGLRASTLLSENSKTIINKLFDSDFVVGEQKDVLASFKTTINNAWDSPTVTMESTFVSIQNALVLAKDLSEKTGNISKDNIGEIIEGLAGNEALKETAKEILRNEQTLKDLGVDEKTAGVIKDTIGAVIDGDYGDNDEEAKEARAKEIDAITEIYDVANKVMASEEGTTLSKEDINAESLVNSIADSTYIKDALLSSGGTGESGTETGTTSGVENLNIGDNLSDEAIAEIEYEIDKISGEGEGKKLTAEEAQKLKDLLTKKSA